MNKIPIKITNKPTQSIKLTNLCPTDHIQKPVGEIAINSNGIFNVEKFASANVNVTPPLQNKKATENGTVVADDGYYGLGEVVVEVESEGESGVPIVVEELPTPTEEDVGKVYLLETKVTPEVGQVVGDKLYFDTSKNPLDYIHQSAAILMMVSNDTNPYALVVMDVLAWQEITGKGHCWVMAFLDVDSTSIFGVPYVDCDMLSVDEFNEMFGSQYGISVTQFGWQTDVVDITSIKDRKITTVYETFDLVKIKSSEYYIGKNSILEVGTSLGNVIHFDTTQNPMDYIDGMTSMAPVFTAANEDDTRGIMFMVGDALEGEGGDMGQVYMIAAAIYDEGSQQISCPYVYCNVLTVDEFNTNLGSMLGISITDFGWQMDKIDTSAVADCVVKENYISEINNIAYGGISFEKIHSDEINKLTAENASLTTANETLTTEKTSLESQVSTLTSENNALVDHRSHILELRLTDMNLYSYSGIFKGYTNIRKITMPINSSMPFLGYLFGASMDSQNNSVIKEIPKTLTEIYITSGETIWGGFFNGCDNVPKIGIPSSIKAMGNAFRDTNFIEVFIEDLESWCLINFYTSPSNNPLWKGAHINIGGERIFELVIPDSIMEIKPFAFTGSYIQSVTIPSGVTSIGEHAFYKCINLNKVYFEEDSQLTSIGDFAFLYCDELKSFTIPSQVISLGNQLFGRKKIEELHCLGATPPTLSTSTFSNAFTDTAKIYVPADSIETYKTADG